MVEADAPEMKAADSKTLKKALAIASQSRSALAKYIESHSRSALPTKLSEGALAVIEAVRMSAVSTRLLVRTLTCERSKTVWPILVQVSVFDADKVPEIARLSKEIYESPSCGSVNHRSLDAPG